MGYALTAQATPTAPAPATAPFAPAAPPSHTSAAPAARPAVAGPALVDQDGRALPAGTAARVNAVYSALSSGDLETVRQAYAAVGSDDWMTSSSHLRYSAVRSKLLAALRSAPAHTANGSYRYGASGYHLTFGTSDSQTSGLELISGPWSTSTNSSNPTSTASSSASSTATRATKSTAICDLSGPPVFGDPTHPNVITNRDCGYTDAQGRARSQDPWIDGQLTATGQ